ncbi:Nn.00g098060.m01.CDS01 [Neocucurbitaria sp. VM-36]
MAIISASAMIRSISLFHVTLAALLLKNPAIVSNQGVVLLLGESMQLQPTPRDFNKPTAATAFIAVLFAFLGLTDLTALSLSDDVFNEFWGAQTPIRCAFLFGLTGYTYIFKEGGMSAPRSYDYRMSAGASLNNSIVFAWGFLELAAWFWVFVTLRDERREKARKLIEQRKAEADRL